MGMSIEEARIALGKERKYALHENKQAFDIAIDTMRKYQMFQTNYVKRLKADMVAMLSEIQLEIEEIEIDVPFGFEPVSKTSAFYEGVSASSRLIQQKINALKADNGNDD